MTVIPADPFCVEPSRPYINELVSLTPDAEALRQNSMAPSTLRAYGSAWTQFVNYCAFVGAPALPTHAAVVANYLSTINTDKSVSLVHLIVSAIKRRHDWDGLQIQGDLRLISSAMEGFKKSKARVVHKAAAIGIELLEKVVREIPRSLIGLRDRAMFLLNFYCGFRRSEVISLLSEHVTLLPDGNFEIVLLQSKTSDVPITMHVSRNQDSVDGVLCPVRAVEAWREAAGIFEGALFRSMSGCGTVNPRPIHVNAFNLRIKAYFGDDFSGHSFRRGLATTLNAGGMNLPEISTQLRHADTKTTMGYIQTATGLEAAENVQKAVAKKRQEVK